MENVVINITNNADVVTINISEGGFLNCADLDNCANFQTVVLGLSDEIADRTAADQNLQTQIDNLPAPVSQDLQSVTANGANTTNQMQINGVNVATVNDILTKLLTGLSITGSSILATDNVLEAFGKLQNQIAGLLGGALPQGVWNASTNTPALASGVGTTGHYYVVNVAGTTTIDGVNDWKVGDWIWFVNGVWHKVDNTDAVSSVNGLIGAVSLVSGDIPESGNLYWTNTRFDARFGLKTTDNLSEGTTNKYLTAPNLGDVINGATSATPNDTDLVMSVESSVAKKNTWTQVKSFLKTYFDTIYTTSSAVAAQITTALSGYITSATAASTYEPIFSKNTAFNKDFGTGITNIPEIGSTLGNSLITSTDASGKLQTLATTTYPSLTELSYGKGVTSAIQTQLNDKLSSNKERLLFVGGFSPINPADGLTYYFGEHMPSLATTAQSFNRFKLNENCTITKVVLTIKQIGNGSNESVSLYLRESATTDNAITTSLDMSFGATTCASFSYTTSITITAANYYEFKMLCPTWANNPTTVMMSVKLYGY